MKKLFFLLSIISVVFSGACEVNTGNYAYKALSSEIAIALAITVLVIIFAYMVGQFLQKTEYTVFSKDELFHLGVSAVILILIGSIIYSTCTITNSFLSLGLDKLKVSSPCYGTFKLNGDTSKFAVCSLEKVENDAKNLLSLSYNKEIALQMDSNWVFTNYFPLMGGITTPTNAYKKTWAMQHATVNSMLITPALISITIQKLLVQFSSDSALSLVLPAGLFFRILNPTRQVGNMFIALSIGLYIILPFSYSLNGVMYDVIMPDCQKYINEISDTVFGSCSESGNFWSIARLMPQAYFLPNLTFALFISYMVGANKALRVIS